MTSKEQGQRKSRIIVVEDHPVLCDGLMQLISSQATRTHAEKITLPLFKIAPLLVRAG
jgi:hypothetical protein